MGQRKILSCHEEPNLRSSDSALPVTRVLHVARIRNVDSIMFVNRIIRRDGEFELGKEIEKDEKHLYLYQLPSSKLTISQLFCLQAIR